MPKKTLTKLPDDLQRAIRRTARNGVRPEDVRVEHVELPTLEELLLDAEALEKVQAACAEQWPDGVIGVTVYSNAAALALGQAHRLIRAELAKARSEGFRAAARMVAQKSDLLRGTRGGVPRACTELDLTVRDLMEAAARGGK
jgi:hypothetical protein